MFSPQLLHRPWLLNASVSGELFAALVIAFAVGGFYSNMPIPYDLRDDLCYNFPGCVIGLKRRWFSKARVILRYHIFTPHLLCLFRRLLFGLCGD